MAETLTMMEYPTISYKEKEYKLSTFSNKQFFLLKSIVVKILKTGPKEAFNALNQAMGKGTVDQNMLVGAILAMGLEQAEQELINLLADMLNISRDEYLSAGFGLTLRMIETLPEHPDFEDIFTELGKIGKANWSAAMQNFGMTTATNSSEPTDSQTNIS